MRRRSPSIEIRFEVDVSYEINFASALILLVAFPLVAVAQSEGYHPVSEGDPSPVDGVCMNEGKATKVAEQKVELKELKLNYASDKKNWVFKEGQFRLGLDERDGVIQDLRDSWWAQNKGSVGLAVGLLLGIVLAIGVAAANTKIQKLANQ